MKGQQEVITLIIITGILFGVIASVWLWATPIVERNKQTLMLQQTEDFMKALSNTIKFVAKNGGKAEIIAEGMDPDGIIMIGQENGKSVIETYTLTDYSFYEKGVEIPLQDMGCGMEEGVWGVDSTDIICIKSDAIGDEVRTKYTMKFIQLNSDSASYIITLLPLVTRSKIDGRTIQIENRGVQESAIDGKKLISTIVSINII